MKPVDKLSVSSDKRWRFKVNCQSARRAADTPTTQQEGNKIVDDLESHLFASRAGGM